ncbi:DUF2938 domain-containing protein [Vandammella animalimorsus]|uniref:DUF2938 domain-containing protein n=1 Tax=Vandammella animalimorsus TaxID=2029117 RepID=UPI00325ABFE8
MIVMDDIVRTVLVGAGATVVMDLWSVMLRMCGIATLDYAWVGRWAGHARRGKFVHPSIARAEPIAGERPLGWAIHYATGIAFAFLLVVINGTEWLYAPTWPPALATGMATVVFPWLVMQPAMGAGIAASRTPAPFKSRLLTLAAHAAFGCGLYAAAALLKQVWA